MDISAADEGQEMDTSTADEGREMDTDEAPSVHEEADGSKIEPHAGFATAIYVFYTVVDSHSLLPLPQRQLREDSAIRATINGDDPLDWPTISGEPLNEFQTEGLASMAFPTLFPYGKGDPTCKSRPCQVKLADGFKHLIRYADRSPEGLIRWRFASHPRFPYWAGNVISSCHKQGYICSTIPLMHTLQLKTCVQWWAS